MFTLFKKMARKSQQQIVDNEYDQRYRESDFGRVFGWWLRLRGTRIAELNYRCWDSDAQFWHNYDLVPFSPLFAEVGDDPNRWCNDDITLESRFAVGYFETGILMAPHPDHIVGLRSSHVPRDVFYRALAERRKC